MKQPPYPHSIDIVRITEVVDAFGQPIDTETTRVETVAYVQGPSIGALAGAPIMGRDALLEDWTVFLPPETVVDRNDLIEFDGKVFEVLGIPSPQYTPDETNHLEAKLRYVEV